MTGMGNGASSDYVLMDDQTDIAFAELIRANGGEAVTYTQVANTTRWFDANGRMFAIIVHHDGKGEHTKMIRK